MLQASGVQTAIITGRDAPSVGIRVKQLGINYYFKGISDKRAAYEELRAQAGLKKPSAPLSATTWSICR